MQILDSKIFFERLGREDNAWDHKIDLDLNTKNGFYNFIKDILAVSNYGGGYLLLGVKDKLMNLLVQVSSYLFPYTLLDRQSFVELAILQIYHEKMKEWIEKTPKIRRFTLVHFVYLSPMTSLISNT